MPALRSALLDMGSLLPGIFTAKAPASWPIKVASSKLMPEQAAREATEQKASPAPMVSMIWFSRAGQEVHSFLPFLPKVAFSPRVNHE